MSATICIPTTRSSQTLKSCLQSIGKLITKRKIRVLLVSKEKIDPHTYPFEIIYTTQKRVGLVGAMNDALGLVTSEFFLRIDDDVTVTPSWLDQMIEPFENTHVGATTGPTMIPASDLGSRDLLFTLTRLEESSNPLLYPFKKLYLDYLYEGKLREVGLFLRSGVFTLGSNFESCRDSKTQILVDHVEACNSAFRTNLLKEAGGFDPSFTKGLGDYHEADISFKIQKIGYVIIFNPKAHVQHNIGNEAPQVRGDAYNRMRNFVRFYKRHIKADTWDKRMRFGTNLAMQNLYFVYKALETGKYDNLLAVAGSIQELLTRES